MPKGKPSSPVKVRLVEEKSVVPEGMEETLKQPLKGYRFSEDALYLVNATRPAPSENILEIGTGCGILSLCLAKQYPTVKITAIEIDEELADCARENAALCGLGNQIQVIQEDARAIRNSLAKHSFHRILTNPPYHKVGKGRLNPEKKRALARHEVSLSLKEILEWSRELLVPGGKINFVFPSERYEEVTDWIELYGLNIIEMEEIIRKKNSIRLFECSS